MQQKSKSTEVRANTHRPALLVISPDGSGGSEVVQGLESEFHVLPATGLHDGLDRLAKPRRPEAVLVEAGAGGMETVREIRRRFPDILLFLVTGPGNGTLARDAFKAGVTGMLIRPFDSRQLCDMVASRLKMFGGGPAGRKIS